LNVTSSERSRAVEGGVISRRSTLDDSTAERAMRRRATHEPGFAYAAPGPAPGAFATRGDVGANANAPRPGPGLMPFDDGRGNKRRRGGVLASAMARCNPWYLVAVFGTMFLYLACYSRKEVVSKRRVRMTRDGLAGDLREARARVHTLENDLFLKNKAWEEVVREKDSLSADLEASKHELEQLKLRSAEHSESLKKKTEEDKRREERAWERRDGCSKELEVTQREMEICRHNLKLKELEFEKMKHEAEFEKMHMKEEVVSEDIKALEEQIAQDEAAEAQAQGDTQTTTSASVDGNK
tara:strand:- start:1703 stop:2593 length:891 start_codon:yes stop_codon:yes gene_type:complete